MNAWLGGCALWAVKSCTEQVALVRAVRGKQVEVGARQGQPGKAALGFSSLIDFLFMGCLGTSYRPQASSSLPWNEHMCSAA